MCWPTRTCSPSWCARGEALATDAITAGLLAWVAFDAGVYLAAVVRAQGDLERRVEPIVLIATLGGVALSLVLGGRVAAGGAVALLWIRAAWDALHMGEGNVLVVPLPRDYALVGLVSKALAGLFFVLFALPA
jgi:hypothetical protein